MKFADRKEVQRRLDRSGGPSPASAPIGSSATRSRWTPGRQRLLLARHRNNFEPIKDVPCEVPVGRWIPLEVRLSGSVIEIFVDGKSVLRHDDGEQACRPGTVGLRSLAARGELSKSVGEDRRGGRASSRSNRRKSRRKSAACGGSIRRGTAQGSFALSLGTARSPARSRSK